MYVDTYLPYNYATPQLLDGIWLPWVMWMQQGDRVTQEDLGLCKEVGGGKNSHGNNWTRSDGKGRLEMKTPQTLGKKHFPKERKWKLPNHQFWLRMKGHHKWEPRRWLDPPAADYVMATANLHGKAREGIFIFSFSQCSRTFGLASSVLVGCVQTVPILFTKCSRGITYFFLVLDSDYFHM